jgi:hypothetical protein
MQDAGENNPGGKIEFFPGWSDDYVGWDKNEPGTAAGVSLLMDRYL